MEPSFLEKQWNKGRRSRGDLVEAGRQTPNRKHIQNLNADTSVLVSDFNRQTLASLGKHIFANFDAVKGPVKEIANYTSRNVEVDVTSPDEKWNNEAETWLKDNEELIDFRGQPYTLRQWRRQLIISIYREGDYFTFLTKGENGQAQIQPVMSHRIGSDEREAIQHGPWKGFFIHDGVIVDGFGRPVAYRYLTGSATQCDKVGKTTTERAPNGAALKYTVFNLAGQPVYSDVSRASMVASFLPDFGDQIRGMSLLAASLFEWQDLKERRSYELLAQKIGATIGLIEMNEDGQRDLSKLALDEANNPTDDDTPLGMRSESIDGIQHRIYKAGSGSGLETFAMDRPTQNQQNYEDKVKRDAMAGIGWAFDLMDPTHVNGGALRWVIDKGNATVEELNDLVVIPASRRVDNFRLSVAIENGDVSPAPAQGYRLEYLTGRRLTADLKYDSQVATQDVENGTGTRKKFSAQRGGTWKRNLAQLTTEAKDVLNSATELQNEFPDMTLDACKNIILRGMGESVRPQLDERDDGNE